MRAPEINAIIEGKELVACQTAVDKFKEIVGLIGGEREKERMTAVLGGIRVIPDQPSPRALSLAECRKIGAMQKAVFGTGDTLQIPTITSNTTFVRAAQSKGLLFSVLVHQARALSQLKTVSL